MTLKQEEGGKSAEKVAIAGKRPTRKKPKDKPKRPLSAYNFFFKEEREKILKVVLSDEPKDTLNEPDSEDFIDEATLGRLRKEGGKVSFEEMGKLIGQRWKNLEPDRLTKYSELAAEDTFRYKKDMEGYNGRQEAKMRTEALEPSASRDSEGGGGYVDTKMHSKAPRGPKQQQGGGYPHPYGEGHPSQPPMGYGGPPPHPSQQMQAYGYPGMEYGGYPGMPPPMYGYGGYGPHPGEMPPQMMQGGPPPGPHSQEYADPRYAREYYPPPPGMYGPPPQHYGGPPPGMEGGGGMEHPPPPPPPGGHMYGGYGGPQGGWGGPHG